MLSTELTNQNTSIRLTVISSETKFFNKMVSNPFFILKSQFCGQGSLKRVQSGRVTVG